VKTSRFHNLLHATINICFYTCLNTFWGLAILSKTVFGVKKQCLQSQLTGKKIQPTFASTDIHSFTKQLFTHSLKKTFTHSLNIHFFIY